MIVVLSVVVLVGWLTGVRSLASLIPGETTIKANHAVGLLLAGVAIALLTSPDPRARVAWRVLGAAVLAIGAAHMVEWVFSVDLGLDELLRRDFDPVAQPGRMAANSAFGLAFVGAALMTTDLRIGRWRPSETFALVAALTGAVALIGYAIQAPTLYDAGAKAAATGAGALLLLGVAILMARPGTGMMRTLSLSGPGGEMARRMLPAVIAVPTALGMLRWYGERLGLWDDAVGIFLLVLSVTVVMCVLVWRMAAWLEGTEKVRRAALGELREADERFAGAFDHASVGMAIVSPHGVFSQVNDELCRIAGRNREELLALGFQDITHPDDLENDLHLLEKLVAGEIGNYQMEKRYRHAAGHYVWILLGVSLVRGEDGAPRYFVALIQDITDRKRAGAALRMQAEMAEHLSEGVCMLRPGDGQVIYANPAFDRMLGCPSGYHVGRESPLPLGYTRERISAEVGEAIARSGRWGEEVEYRRMDGSTLWCHIGVSRFEDPEHGTLSVVIQTDISARREADERLARQHKQLVEAQSIARMGSWEYDLRTKETQWSEQQFRIYGLDPADSAPDADGYLALVHPEDRGLAAAAAPTAGEREYRIVRPDGQEAIVHTTTEVAEADGDGKPLRIGGTTQDVTERREAEAALRDAENLFRGAFEDAPIGMALASLDGRFMQVNAALAAITGFTREHLTDMPFEQITHPDDRGNDVAAFEEMITGQRSSYNVEKRYVHSDGHPVWVAVNVNLIRGADGEPRHFLTQVQDVTERRRYESRLQHMADHDPLTGLLNRRSFERELRAQTARMRRYGPEGAAILIDVDNFKAVNDTFGHQAGDELIVRVARALQGRLRDTDVLARMGGDEFAVLLPKEGAAAATDVAQALLERIRQETRPTRGSSRPGNLTASVGVAAFGDGGTLTGEDVLLRADVAMYDAKAAGRDQVALHRPEQPA